MWLGVRKTVVNRHSNGCDWISAADTSTNQQPRTNATTIFPTQADGASQIIGKTSFAVPAPPPLASAEKVRRLSDGEHFRQPNVTVGGHATVQKQLQEAQTQAQAQALAEMILKVNPCTLYFPFNDIGGYVESSVQSTNLHALAILPFVLPDCMIAGS